jgi:hypothetical protein
MLAGGMQDTGIAAPAFHVVPLSVPNVFARVEFRDNWGLSNPSRAQTSKFRSAVATAAGGDFMHRAESLIMQRVLASMSRSTPAESVEFIQRTVDVGPDGRGLPSLGQRVLGEMDPLVYNAEMITLADSLIRELRLPRPRPARGRRGAAASAPSVQLEVRIVWQRAPQAR